MKHGNSVHIYVIVSLFLANVGIWSAVGASIWSSLHPVVFYFLDVGQGDAGLLRLDAGNILIDGGRSRLAAIRELDSILPISDRTIDIMVLSHPQLDHIGGLLEVMRRYNVRLLMLNGTDYALKEYRLLLDAAREKRIPILYAVRGEEIIAGDSKLTVLNPPVLLKDTAVDEKNMNDTSIVMKFVAAGVSMLFTGDITAKKERELIELVGLVDILKVAHHGSKFSSDASFLAAIRPKLAVIGVGKNPYGHPNNETLSRLTEAGAHIFRTDKDGTIMVIPKKGQGFNVISSK